MTGSKGAGPEQQHSLTIGITTRAPPEPETPDTEDDQDPTAAALAIALSASVLGTTATPADAFVGYGFKGLSGTDLGNGR